MLTKIDWISFSFEVDPGREGEAWRLPYRIEDGLMALSPMVWDVMFANRAFDQGKGRAPYSVSYREPNGGWTTYGHPSLSHALVEISGRGCDELIALGIIDMIMREVAHRATRLDIACDIACETNPIDFAAQRDGGRFKTTGQFVSDTGTTVYIGSRKSNRYCRVYRYNHPHERAALLRIEYVLRSDDAKLTTSTIVNEGMEGVVVALGEQFGWQHPVWDPGVSQAAELKTYRPDRHAGRTLVWLAGTVAPAIIKLHKEGVLDAYAWFSEHIAAAIDKDAAGEYDMPVDAPQ